MSDDELRQALSDLRAQGEGSHVHLDEVLSHAIAPTDAAQWLRVARRLAEIASEMGGRFIVAVPLGSATSLPTDLVDLDELGVLDADEPPAVHCVAVHDEPRTWVGEHYRRDLPDSTPTFLHYVSAFRDADAREAGEPFSLGVYFDVRS